MFTREGGPSGPPSGLAPAAEPPGQTRRGRPTGGLLFFWESPPAFRLGGETKKIRAKKLGPLGL